MGTQMLGLIESQDMMGFVDGTLAAPSETITAPSGTKEIENPEFHLWRCSDRLLRGWLTGTMNEDALSLVVGLKTAHEVWEAMNNSFAQGSQEREFYLQQHLQLHRKGTSTLSDYIWDLKSLCDDLAAIGKPVEDKKKFSGC